MKLTRFAKNPFDSKRFSIGDLVAFTTDHQQKMIKNNPGGKLTDRIVATEAALTAVDRAYADETTRLAIRKARKFSKNTFREQLGPAIARIHAAVEAKYGVDAPAVTECFGDGLTIFHTVRDDVLLDKLSALIDGLTAHQPDLAEALAQATTLHTTWAALHEASEDSSSDASKAMLDRRAARQALALELFKNLLTIALNFPAQPDQIVAYMQQSLLTGAAHPEAAPAPPPAPDAVPDAVPEPALNP